MDAAPSKKAWSTSTCTDAAVRAQLDRIFKSAAFEQSRRRQRFLEYIVKETLAGRGDRLKGYTIAREVFDRPDSFDANVDPLVRVEAGRLRDRLREYYDAEGSSDAIRIELPKGSYRPHIELRQEPAQQASPGDGRQVAAAAISPPSNQFDIASLDWKYLAAAAALVTFLFAGYWSMARREPIAELPNKPAIAVLPFKTIGSEPTWQRLAGGMTEDIITDLSHSKDLIVIARNSTEAYKDKPIDVRQVGRDLNVKYVLEGSIQPMGDNIRVTAQLVEAISGSHIWSERYDRPDGGLFAVQNEVTQRIAATVSGYEGVVAEAERNLIRRKPPASLTAFDTYLLAMEAKHKVTKDGLVEAEGLFRKALELDPQLARAHVGLVDVQFYLIDLGLAPSIDEALAKMMASGETAVALDPNDGKTHYALGLASLYNGKPQHAAAEFVRAETLAPSDADMLVCIGWSLPMLGESQRAVRLVERALLLNPHYPDWYNQGLSYVFFFGAQYERSLKHRLQVKSPLALDYAFLAMTYAYLGRTGEAATATAKVRNLDPAWNAERYLSDSGGFADKEAELFVAGARKAGLSACVPAEESDDRPNLIHVSSCDQQRTQ